MTLDHNETLIPIGDIAARLQIPEEYIEPRGRYSAKIRLELLSRPSQSPEGKLVLVTATTPTKYGEGKTVVTIGLTQALHRLGQKVVATLREPSLGPVLGTKGGATGGGLSQVLPHDLINLNFHGDFPAITAAHNTLAALIDSHLYYGNPLGLDPAQITWPRTMDMNDRALRQVVTGLGGRNNGVCREGNFVITAASEIMAIMALAGSRQDLRRRLGEIVVGYTREGKAVKAADLGGVGALMVLLNDALMPNLVQTTEGAPALVHCGPFGNIAHGTSSILAQKMGLECADLVVNEAGFGSDLGAEKYFDIVVPLTGVRPACAVLVTSIRSLQAQGADEGEEVSQAALRRGLVNLERHLENCRKYGVPVVVALNQFPDDAPRQMNYLKDYCAEHRVPCAVADVFGRGGAGGEDLACQVKALVDSPRAGEVSRAMAPLYPPTLSLTTKIETIAREIYGADGIYVESEAMKKLQRYTELGYGHLPVCMAKTQSSVTDNPKAMGAPRNWTLRVTDASLSAGAGFVVAVAGSMLLMPGLPAHPQAFNLDVDEAGHITGLR